MLLKKIRFVLRQLSQYANQRLSFISLNGILSGAFYVFLIMVLAINGYTAYTRGMENLQRLDEEQARTDALQKEHDELTNLYKYYGSIDYKKIYARDNLNMAERSETLYFIEKHEVIEVEKPIDKNQKITIDNGLLWRKLLFTI